LKHLLRCRINKIIKYKRNKSSIDVLGCDIEYFISYIEKKFDENMSWNNYGYHGWHIDHIIPISSAKNEEDLLKLSHYTNLQPLWKEENLKKSNKLINN
jgi:5-methylcytosine-specific restriction endonuclease McrA